MLLIFVLEHNIFEVIRRSCGAHSTKSNDFSVSNIKD